MEKSKVYFTDMRALPGTSLLQKLKKLLYAAGINQIDFDGKFAAIKIHFGEPGNLSFLRPNFTQSSGRCGKRIGWETLFDRLQHPVCGPAQECPGSHGCRL